MTYPVKLPYVLQECILSIITNLICIVLLEYYPQLSLPFAVEFLYVVLESVLLSAF